VLWVALSAQLCERYERVVGADNCVKFERLSLQIPVLQHRCHYVKAKVQVHRAPEMVACLSSTSRGSWRITRGEERR
jgi:hypothetical protein